MPVATVMGNWKTLFASLRVRKIDSKHRPIAPCVLEGMFPLKVILYFYAIR